jgi:hypothetical protein
MQRELLKSRRSHESSVIGNRVAGKQLELSTEKETINLKMPNASRDDGVVGYRICLTHRRSSVRTWVVSLFFVRRIRLFSDVHVSV